MAKTLRVEIVGDSSSLQRALNRASAASATFGGRMSAAGASIAATGEKMNRKLTLPIVAAAGASLKFASDFESSMELIHTQSGAAQSEVTKLHDKVLALAPTVGTGPDELAKGLYHLESQGLRNNKAMAALEVAAKGARVGMADLEDVTNALGAVVTVGIKGTENYEQAMGALNATVGEGDMRMQDLADALGTNLVGQAKIAGVSITDLGGALAVFGDANIRGADAGTMLSQAIRVLGAGSKATDKALQGIGLSSKQLSQDMRSHGIIGALEDLQGHMKRAGMDADDMSIFLSRTFGGKQAAGIKLLLAQLDRLHQKTDAVGEGANSFAKVWDDTTKTTAFKFHAMTAGIEAALVEIGGHLLGPATILFGWIERAAKAFGNLSPQMQKTIMIAAGVAAAWGPLVTLFGRVVQAVGFLSEALLFLAANPVVLAVAAIAAVAAAIAAAVLFPDQFAAALERMGVSAEHAQAIVSTLQGIFEQVKAIVSGAVNIVQALWARFGDLILSETRAWWSAVQNEFRAAFQIIQGLVNIFGGILTGDWSRVWEGIKQVFAGAWLAIKTQVQFALTTLRNEITAGARAWLMELSQVWGVIKANATAAWNALVAIVQGVVGRVTAAAEAVGRGIVNGIKHGLATLVAAVKGGLDKIWGVISNVAAHAYSAAIAIGASLIHGIADGIRHALGEAIGAIRSAGSSLVHAATGFLHINSPSLLFSDEVGRPITEGIAHGILAGVPAAIGVTTGALSTLKGSIKSQLGPNFGSDPAEWARINVGEKLVHGIAAGILGQLGQAQNATEQAKNVVKANLQAGQIAALVHEFGRQIGYAHAQGVVMGMLQGTPSIVQQARQALIQATAAAKQAAEDARGSFVSAFENMAQQALAAFDAKFANWKPKAQIQLEKMQLEDQKNQAQGAVDQAQAGLANAQQAAASYTAGEGETPEQVAADQKALNDAIVSAQAQLTQAIRAQKELQLQMEAEEQQKIHDANLAKQREGLAKQLAHLEQELLKHPEEWKKMGARVKAILHEHGVELIASGTKWADNFADGIRKGIPAAEAAAKALAEAVDKYMPHSPAKEGPLSYDAADSGRAWSERFAFGFIDHFGSFTSAPGFGPPRTAAPVTGSRGGTSSTTSAATGGGGITVEGDLVVHNDVDVDRMAAKLGRRIAIAGL